MAMSLRMRELPDAPEHARRARAAAVGISVAVALMSAAMVIPWLTGWNVHVFSFPPLHAAWEPRFGTGTIPATAVAVMAWLYAVAAAETMAWGRLLALGYVGGLTWLVSLAAVDGRTGLGHILDTRYEYLDTARGVTSISQTLHEYASRIPYSSADNWPVHVAGHPPGALLFFVGLVTIGLGAATAAGAVVIGIAATTPLAVLVTMRRLGAEAPARIAAPFLVLGPAAIWMAVSADAVFTAAAAWGLCCLAIAATSQRRTSVAGWAVAAGLLLGYCVMMSYGLPLLSVLAVAILVSARTWSPLPWAAGAAMAVVLGFALAGFAWWEAYPLLRDRYWDGVASRRPMAYWVWGDLAALCFSAGPILGASVALAGRQIAARARGVDPTMRPVVLLVLAGLVTVLIADLSGMSKAEVERIWLPFVPWLLAGTALLTPRWRRPALLVQLVTAILIQHLLQTGW